MSEHGIVWQILAPFGVAVGVLGGIATVVCGPFLVGWAVSGNAGTGVAVALVFWFSLAVLGLLWLMGWVLMGDE